MVCTCMVLEDYLLQCHPDSAKACVKRKRVHILNLRSRIYILSHRIQTDLKIQRLVLRPTITSPKLAEQNVLRCLFRLYTAF